MDVLTEADFDGARLKRAGPVVVTFVADWCGSCRRFAPIATAYAEKHPDVPHAFADASDDDGPLWDAFGLEIVPSIAAFYDGELVARRDGKRGWGLPEDAPAEMAAALRRRMRGG
ncbi:MAG TPA: thioredoxin family protein [Candidatus Thermoplasmatota archaeon]|nr:thioredoxin family protein [Candidatus Thermoplasmatota archaeon]